jgi:hypothetical protein
MSLTMMPTWNTPLVTPFPISARTFLFPYFFFNYPHIGIKVMPFNSI